MELSFQLERVQCLDIGGCSLSGTESMLAHLPALKHLRVNEIMLPGKVWSANFRLLNPCLKSVELDCTMPDSLPEERHASYIRSLLECLAPMRNSLDYVTIRFQMLECMRPVPMETQQSIRHGLRPFRAFKIKAHVFETRTGTVL